MAVITPAQLQPLATFGETLTGSAVFIVQQGTVVAKVDFTTLKSVLITAINAATNTAIANQYSSALASLTNLNSLLGSKAAATHTHTAASVGLGNVQNIAPMMLPISTALQTALNLKANISDTVVGQELQIAGVGPEW